jgi:lipopolysaccharide export system permease protein
MILQFDNNNTFLRRLDTTIAQLNDGYWLVRSGWLSTPMQASQQVEAYRLPTDMTREKLQDSFASPHTLTFWELPAFIRVLEQAGFSALRHKMHWQSLLATPLTFTAMVLVAALFALRIPRRGHIMLLIVGGLGVGFLYYFMADFMSALGISGRLPISLAAWSPPVLYILLSLTALLHTEDG